MVRYDAGIGASVLQARNHLNRDGLFENTGITAASLPTFQRDTTFAGSFSGPVYGTALYLENGPQGDGAFFVATESNYVFALDEVTGQILPNWPIQAGTPATQPGTLPGCTPLSPIGITGTPAIDLSTRLIVFDAATGDSNGNVVAHTIQAWSVDAPANGPVWTLNVGSKWPAFDPKYQHQRGAVLIVNGVAYVAYGSYNDCAPFHGWVVGVPLGNPSGAQAFMTPVVGGGIWGPGGPASDGTSIFAVTSNRRTDVDVDSGTPAWAGSNAVFRLGSDLTFSGKPTDYFVPVDWDQLDRGDFDLGSSGPLVIDAPAMVPSQLVMAMGKGGIAYLLDRNNLGGMDAGPIASTVVVQGLPGDEGQIINAAAWATSAGKTYVVIKGYFSASAADCPLPVDGGTFDLVALVLDPTAQNYMRTAWCVSSGGMGSPSITMSDDDEDAIVWAGGAEGDNRMHAWDLATGALLYQSNSGDIGAVRRFITPIGAHGRIFIPGDNMLYAFAAQPSNP
jgi:hypothetical protein